MTWRQLEEEERGEWEGGPGKEGKGKCIKVNVVEDLTRLLANVSELEQAKIDLREERFSVNKQGREGDP
jgi:hypothetical protein